MSFMSAFPSEARLAPLRCLLAGVILGTCACSSAEPAAAPPPARASGVQATWVVRTDLASDASVDRVVDEAARGGIDTLIVQVRGRGDAWFRSRLEPPPPVLQGRSADPLGRLLGAAHARGIQVHAWINADLIWDPEDPNQDPRHVVHAHPEWLSLPRDLAPRLLRGPAGRTATEELLAWVGRRRNRVEGLYGEPTNPAYRRHVVDVCRDLVTRYPLQGIHLDYIRYPNPDWGYSRAALELFRNEVDRDLSATERRDMQGRVLGDPLVYTRRYPRRWNSFRTRGVTSLVSEVAAACRSARPGILMSAAVFPVLEDALQKRFQDWGAWLDAGLLDVACQMNYAAERPVFERRALAALKRAGPERLWAGIGAWKLDPRETGERVSWLRDQGARSVVLFSQGGLRARKGAFEALGQGVFARHSGAPDTRP